MNHATFPKLPPRKPLAEVCLLLFAGAVLASAQERSVILQEDFASYPSTEAMRAVWTGGSGVLEMSAPGGGQAVLHDGGQLNSRGELSVRADATHNVVFTADLYDFGTNSNKRITVALRNNSDPTIEFGMLNEIGCYTARAVGFGVPPGWQAFDPAQKPVQGWHRFQAVITLTNTVVTLDFGADGTIDKTLTFDGPAPTKRFNMVRFGGLPDRVSHGGPVLVDNIKVELVNFGPPIVASASPGGNTRTNAVPIQTAQTAQVPAAATPELRATIRDDGSVWGAAIWGIVAGMVVVIGLLVWMALLLRRGVPNASLALVPASPHALARGAGGGAAAEPATGEEWRQRALAAEALADKQAQVLRDKMVPELAEFAKKSLVQGLFNQRNELVETQQKAQQELAELEARLAALHLPFQERIRVYEKRIGELEKELESRGEEMRELIRATLLLVRQRLDEEKEKESKAPRLN